MIYKTLCAGIFCITVADAAKFMFFVPCYYLSTDQNLLSYHSISSLPTHTQGSSFTTHRLFSDSKAVFSVGGWSHTPLHCLWQNAHWCWCLCCTAGHPYCSSIPSSNSFSKQPTVQYARYSILVPLLLNQPWRIVSGVMVWETGIHCVKWRPRECGRSCSKPIHLVTKEVLFSRLTENIALVFSQTQKDAHLWFRIRNPISMIIWKAPRLQKRIKTNSLNSCSII